MTDNTQTASTVLFGVTYETVPRQRCAEVFVGICLGGILQAWAIVAAFKYGAGFQYMLLLWIILNAFVIPRCRASDRGTLPYLSNPILDYTYLIIASFIWPCALAALYFNFSSPERTSAIADENHFTLFEQLTPDIFSTLYDSMSDIRPHRVLGTRVELWSNMLTTFGFVSQLGPLSKWAARYFYQDKQHAASLFLVLLTAGAFVGFSLLFFAPSSMGGGGRGGGLIWLHFILPATASFIIVSSIGYIRYLLRILN